MTDWYMTVETAKCKMQHKLYEYYNHQHISTNDAFNFWFGLGGPGTEICLYNYMKLHKTKKE